MGEAASFKCKYVHPYLCLTFLDFFFFGLPGALLGLLPQTRYINFFGAIHSLSLLVICAFIEKTKKTKPFSLWRHTLFKLAFNLPAWVERQTLVQQTAGRRR